VSGYDDLLGATIDFLEAEKSRGQQFVSVDWEKVEALSRPIEPPAEMTFAPSPEVAEKEISKSTGNMDELRARALVCERCPNLVAARKQVVFGVGNEAADLMFVGEAPGADEDEQGEPFVGAAGQLLTRIIQTMGLSRNTVYIANILKCRPDTPGQRSGNRAPTREEMDTCSPWLHRQIEIIQPKVIVALGKTAVGGLLEMENVPITKFRGTWQTYRGIPLMPTFHPAYLLHQQSLASKRALWEDMLAAMEKLGMPISEKQRGFFLPR
jgi:DNA polymerase